MNETNILLKVIVIVLLAFILGFFFMNNISHTGFHMGHYHEDGYVN